MAYNLICLIILAHPDDEVFLIPRVIELKASTRLIFAYLTDPGEALRTVRQNESLSVLRRFGISEEDVWFIGSATQTADGALHLEAEKVLQNLISRIDFLTISITSIYTPLWEGGHQDHDACCHIAWNLKTKLPIPQPQITGFSMYHGEGSSGLFFRTHIPPSIYKKATTRYRISLKSALTTVRAMFGYFSQWKTFLGLGPFIAWHSLVRRHAFYVRIEDMWPLQQRPHDGPLLYERYGRTTFEKVKSALEKLNKNDQK